MIKKIVRFLSIGLICLLSGSSSFGSELQYGFTSVYSEGLGFDPLYLGSLIKYNNNDLFIETEVLASHKLYKDKGWGAYIRVGKSIFINQKIYIPIIVEIGGQRETDWNKIRYALNSGIGYKTKSINFLSGLDIFIDSPTNAKNIFLRIELLPEKPFIIRFEQRIVLFEQNNKKEIGERSSISILYRIKEL